MTLNNSIMVAKHMHKQLQFIFQALKYGITLAKSTQNVEDVRHNVGTLHFKYLDRIWSRLNSVPLHVN